MDNEPEFSSADAWAEYANEEVRIINDRRATFNEECYALTACPHCAGTESVRMFSFAVRCPFCRPTMTEGLYERLD